jgi:hypothetical protein
MGLRAEEGVCHALSAERSLCEVVGEDTLTMLLWPKLRDLSEGATLAGLSFILGGSGAPWEG